MERLRMLQYETKVVVGLDFGTTFSGFAFALRADPDNIYTFYDWPMQSQGGGLPYCKTQTSLLYAEARDPCGHDDQFELQEWGWPAYVAYKSTAAEPAAHVKVSRSLEKLPHSGGRKKPSPAQHFVSLFKLYLATKATSSTASPLPPGLTARRAITDFLRQMSKCIMQEVRHKFGPHISLEDIEWCLTIPAIWDDDAKKEMRVCAEMAGLVRGPLNKDDSGSPHPLKLLIEPEAASVYCQLKLKGHKWATGDKLLVVDCGGGTVDVVLQEKLGSYPSVSVREIQESSGELCGGSRVDEEFIQFLKDRISSLKRFEREFPATVLAFRQKWEKLRNDYNGEMKDVHLLLPPTLAAMWEADERTNSSQSFDELVVTNADMRSFFDPVVDKILHLIFQRLVPDLKAVVVVGGFSESPYLRGRIKEALTGKVATVVSPPFPGSAVCCGAVTMGIRSKTVISRISKKTYGIRHSIPFVPGVHPVSSRIEDTSGRLYYTDAFHTFVRTGDEVGVDDCVRNVYGPFFEFQTSIGVKLYTSDCEVVTSVTDPGVHLEGEFIMQIPSQRELGYGPGVEVCMFFGRSDIQVTGVGINFESEKTEMRPVKFQKDSVY